jgi:hypothetical protein
MGRTDNPLREKLMLAGYMRVSTTDLNPALSGVTQ